MGKQKRATLGAFVAGIASGLLLVLSLPKPDLYPLAWIALIPLLISIVRARTWRETAITSYTAGFVFFAGTFYWITETMIVYGGLGPLSAVGVGLLFAVTYALHFVLFAIPVWWAVRRWGPAGVLTAAPIWVTVELMRTYWFSGFPWMVSGYALVPFSGLLQLVTWTGIYGLSFISTAVNSAVAYGFVERKWNWIGGAAGIAIVLSLLPILPTPQAPTGDPLKVRIVQTNISIDQPWSEPEPTQRLMNDISQLSTAEPGQTQLIVWPETPAPFYLKEDPEFRRRIQQIVEKSDAYMLVGYIDRIADGPTNSAALVNPHGEIVSRYDKIHLVPFGEYIPMKTLLFFADSLTREVGDFKPGSDLTVSTLDHHHLSTAICYESIFPNLVRQFVKRESELLVVITNDGWFGQSSAPYQHLRMGVVRAVENRRYEVRDANTGISAIIDPYGRILKSTPIGQRMVLDGTVYFRTDKTFYTEYGDVFAYINVIAAIWIAVAAVYDRRFSGRKEPQHVRRTH
jgi:apolipoprotein N-acyltransferase